MELATRHLNRGARSGRLISPQRSCGLHRTRTFEERVGRLRETLSQPDIRTEAASVLRQLLVGITIVPDGEDGPEVELTGSATRMIA